MNFHAPEYVRGIAPYQAGKPISELAREYGLREDSIVIETAPAGGADPLLVAVAPELGLSRDHVDRLLAWSPAEG